MNKLNKLKYFQEEMLNEANGDANVSALLNMPVKGYRGDERFVWKYNLEPEEVSQFVSQVKPLQISRIVKGAGAGKFGITYVLDNDHILKFFQAAHLQSVDDELKKFRDIQTRQFQGTSHRGEPAVYDIGSVPVHRWQIAYVELGRVVPFDDWMKRNRQDTSSWKDVLSVADQFFHQFHSQILKMNTRDIINIFLRSYGDLKAKLDVQNKNIQKEPSNTNKMSEPTSHPHSKTLIRKKDDDQTLNKPWTSNNDENDPEKTRIIQKERNEPISGISQTALIGLLKGLINYSKKTGRITDFHSGNFGVIPSNSSKEPDVFVFFDI